jgi:uncharacterized protein YkwD
MPGIAISPESGVLLPSIRKGTPVIIRSVIITLAVLLTPGVAQAADVSLQIRSEQQVLTLLNEIRAQHRLPALALSAPLRNAARAHSLDMFRRGYFAHNSPEETATARIARYLKGAKLSENIGWGIGLRGAPPGLVYGWMESPAHRAVILDPALRRVGLGIALGTFGGKRGTVLATADFAA